MAEILILIIGILLFAALTLMTITFFGTGLLIFIGSAVAVMIVGFIAYAMCMKVSDAARRRMQAAQRAAEMDAQRHDPVHVAATHDPESKAAVEIASSRISLLRGIAKDSSDLRVVDALVLADVRVPDLMRRCVSAIDACADDEERRHAARKALLAYVEIGEQVDAARRHVLSERDDALDTSLRYLAARSGDDSLLRSVG